METTAGLTASTTPARLGIAKTCSTGCGGVTAVADLSEPARPPPAAAIMPRPARVPTMTIRLRLGEGVLIVSSLAVGGPRVIYGARRLSPRWTGH